VSTTGHRRRGESVDRKVPVVRLPVAPSAPGKCETFLAAADF
jgi:hypothetical protein